ncbi:potassium channel family protein [Thalassorhabdus alkalitolerans]
MLPFHKLTQQFAKSHLLTRLFLVIGIIIISISWLMHRLEPHTFPTYFDAVWWAIVSASTVGYGDLVPDSTIGRVIAIILILFGIGFVTFFVTSLAATTVTEETQWRQGKLSCRYENHCIVIGWNEKSRQVIKELQRQHSQREIVLIDETLQQPPFPRHSSVHFIQGNPNIDETLQKANISKAASVLITAGRSMNEQDSDARTILTLLAVKSNNDKAMVTVEILTPELLANAKRAGADEVIESTYVTSLLMSGSTIYPGVASIITDLLEHEDQYNLKMTEIKDEWVGLSFEELLHEFRKEGKLPLGVKRQGKMLLNPNAPFFVSHEDSILFVDH